MLKIAERHEHVRGQKSISGLAFVRTGDLENFGSEGNGFSNDYSDLKAYIEERGGFLRSAVSSNTDYVICNDINSDTAKSKEARRLGIPVITEQEFLEMADGK